MRGVWRADSGKAKRGAEGGKSNDPSWKDELKKSCCRMKWATSLDDRTQ